MVPYDYLPFIYITCGSFECSVNLYGEGFVDEGKEIRQKCEDQDAAMFGGHNGVDILFFNRLQ